MFTDFLALLRGMGLTVSTTEWLAFQGALAADLAEADLERFYHLSRALLIKDERHYDRFDQAFLEHFHGVVKSPKIKEEMLRWLARESFGDLLDEAELEALDEMSLEDLMELFEKRLEEQREEHHGGSKWIGTGGLSPFGHSGRSGAPPGVRVAGEGRHGRAMKVAARRRFKNLRHDLTLDIRQMSVALRKLRRLGREGRRDELDIDDTIRATCDNAGEIELRFQPARRNSLKLCLLCDVGGSMEPFRKLSERLFSAAHKARHFRRFRSYYFHNCIYSELFADMGRRRSIALESILRDSDPDECLIIVGDAAMAPSELWSPYGAVEYWLQEAAPGLESVERLARAMPRSVWLNPLPRRVWSHPTVAAIGAAFDMHELTLEGLESACDGLRRKGRRP
jgi:uncharacterized protein